MNKVGSVSIERNVSGNLKKKSFYFKEIFDRTKILILAFLFTIMWTLSDGVGLECSFRMSMSYLFVGSVYECDAAIEGEIESSGEINEVNGTHQSDRTHADVLALQIMNAHDMPRFPINIDQFFPNVKLLRLISTSISYVSTWT